MDVILFGADTYNTLGALRSLRAKKINIFLILVSKKKINYILFSKFLQTYIIVQSEQEGINYLIKNQSLNKTVILPTSDKSVSLLDKHFDILHGSYIFPTNGGQGGLTQLMDKEKMLDYASSVGLDVPLTIRYSKEDQLPDNLVFPCMIKPVNSMLGSKKEMSKCVNKEEVKQAIDKAKQSKEFVIQEYIEKEYDILIIGARFFSNDKVFIPAVLKKERWYGLGDDGSMGILTTDVEKYIDIKVVETLIKKTNYYGPFSIEFGVMKQKLYFYEINFRNDGTSHYFNALNINIPYMWVLDAYGHHIDINQKLSSKEHLFIDEFGDYLNIVTNRLPINKWYRNFRQATVFKYYYRGDLKPFLLIIPHMILLSIYKILKYLIDKIK